MSRDQFFDSLPFWLDLTAVGVLLSVVPGLCLLVIFVVAAVESACRLRTLLAGQFDREMHFRMKGKAVLS